MLQHKPRQGVFISYARSDGEAFARRLRQRLEDEKIKLWQDRAGMEGGRDWWLQITEALDEVEFMALVMTPNALKSATVRKEWRYARQQGVCVYPIQSSPEIDFNLLPRWMRDAHFYDLGNVDDDSAGPEWEKFLNDLKRSCQTPRVPFMVEDLPEDFVERPGEFDRLIALLLNHEREEPVAITAALRGAGGFGKTTLAKALCHDERIQDAFDDGILWVTLGENPGDLTGRVEDLIYTLSGERPGFSSIDAATARLLELLANRDVLIVIDDVWNGAHLRPFLQGGLRCARLITTRNLDTLPSKVKTVDVDAMKRDEAVTLLCAGLEQYRDSHGIDQNLRVLASRLGEWPLLLKLANGTLRHRVFNINQNLAEALVYIDRALDKRGLTAFDARDAEARHQAVKQTLSVSLELLSPVERQRYGELAVFPEDIDIPLATLTKLWGRTGGLDEFDTEELCDRLNRLSLLLRFDMTTRCIGLHDVVRKYLIQEQHPSLRQLHLTLLEVHRPSLAITHSVSKRPGWADLSVKEPYLWDHLAYHLVQAENQAELIETVKDLRYLCAKTSVLGVQAVELDLLAAEIHAPDDSVLRLLRRSFVQASHILNRCDKLNDLEATLHSRVQHLDGLKPQTQRFAQILSLPYLAPAHSLPDLPPAALVRTLSKHTDAVISCAISSDNSFIVSASNDKTLKIWDAKTGDERFTLAGHSDSVTSCDISPDGSYIVSASADRTLKIWNSQTGAERLTLSGHADVVRGCAISPDNSFIVSASNDKTLKIWEAQSGIERYTLRGHTNWVNHCAISHDGCFIVSASDDNSLIVWNAKTGAKLLRRIAQAGIEHLRLTGHQDSVIGCAISNDNSLIVSASDDMTLKVWDTGAWSERFTLAGHTFWVNSCAISSDGSFIVSASSDQTLKVWDVKTGAERFTLSGHTDVVAGCAISPDSSYIVSASYDRTLKVWDIRSGAERRTSSGHLYWVTGCAVSPDGSFVVSASNDRTLKVWDTTTGSERLTLAGHTFWVTACAISPDGSFIVSASSDQTLKVWDAQTGAELLKLSGHNLGVNGCAVSPDGSFIVSASSDQTLKVWDSKTGAQILTLTGQTDVDSVVTDCAISPDGSFIVSASSDQTLRVWDVATGQEKLKLAGHTGVVSGCAVSPNGDFIVSASQDRTLKIWDAVAGNERLTLVGHKDWVKSCAFSPDSSFIASVSDDNTIKVWDARDGNCLATLYTDGPLKDCDWLPDNRHLVAVGNGGVYFLRFVQ
jgi:WD40 repeat protein